MTDEPRTRFIEGLRDLADWYEQNPDLELPYDVTRLEGLGVHVHAVTVAEARTQLGALAIYETDATTYKDMVACTRSFGSVRLVVTVRRDDWRDLEGDLVRDDENAELFA